MIRLPDWMLEDFTYQRNTVGSYVNGRWTPGTAEAAATARGAIQPLNSDEVELLPEGQRNKDTIKVYTETELKVIQEKNKIKGDIITARGFNWEAQRVFEQGTPFSHYKVLCVKVEYQ